MTEILREHDDYDGLENGHSNHSSIHRVGRRTRKAVEDARRRLA